MVWYIPPLSPIQSAAEAGHMQHKTVGKTGVIPDVSTLRIPMRYLANLLTAGDEAPVQHALERLLAMRAYMRAESVPGAQDQAILADVGLDRATVRDLYPTLTIPNYTDRLELPYTRKHVGWGKRGE